MFGAQDYPSIIRQLNSELNAHGDRWQTQAYEFAKGRLPSPRSFIDWAKQDRHWSFTLAEVMGDVCAKPSELAARLLVAIIEELREEQQTAQALAE